jgi:asparagine synthase (glutamine-hydrolysing)
MIAGHAVLDLRWDGSAHVATGEREHTLGLSVIEGGVEKGMVARWRFDGETLVVEGEPYGYHPLFVYETANRIIVGTSPIALVAAGADPAIDREAIGLYLRIGFYLGERTPFRHIRLAPRGKTLRWTRGHASAIGPGLTIVPPTIRSIEEGIEGYCDLFRTAMRRRPPTAGHERSFAMPLSGGRDSRMMLLGSLENGFTPATCVNISGGERADHPDAVVARMLCERTGVPLRSVDSRAPWIENETRKHVLGGLLAMEHTWMMPLWDTLRAEYPCWYDGLGAGAITRGDLCKPSCLEKYRSGAWREFMAEFTSYAFSLPEETIHRLAKTVDWIDPSLDTAIGLVREELSRSYGAANPLTSFSFMNWGGRAISLNPNMLCATVRDIHTPFMDADLVRFLLGYPIEFALENDLQTDAVKRLYPSFADVPFDKDLPKWKRPRKPLFQALAGRVSTMCTLHSSSRTFGAMGAAAALKGDGRTTTMLTMLGLLEQASSKDGASRLLRDWGFGSDADRRSLARYATARSTAA